MGGLARALVRVGIVAYVVIGVLVGVVAARSNALRDRRPLVHHSRIWTERAREISFPTSDGLTLKGLKVPPVGEAPVLLVLHGVAANRDDVTPWARPFVLAGYGALAFDWRAHGESDGDVIGFGAREHLDVLAALEVLDADPAFAGRPIGILATSMGASIAAMSAPHLPSRVSCMVLDSPYGSLPRMLENRLRVVGPLRPLAAASARFYSRHAFGMDLDAVVPEAKLPAFAPRTILVFHGARDTTTPQSEGRSLAARYPGPKGTWFTDHEHVRARTLELREWTRRVATFFADQLPGGRPTEEVLGHTPATVQDLFAAGRAP